MTNSDALIGRRATVGVFVCLAVLSACGGGAESDAKAAGADDRTTADAPEPATASDSDETDDSPPADEADSAKGGDDAGGLIDVSDVDWSTVDLTTIDWENIDITQLRTDLVEQNPTVGDLSPDDLAIIQRRITGSFGSGAVTVTIDGRTLELQGFDCAFESSGVLNEGTIFGSNLFGELDGVRIQLQIDSYEDGGSQFTMDDIDDFENPSVSYSGQQGIEVTIDGNDVHAEGLVVDNAQDAFPEVPMTFDASCGPGSLR